MDLFDLTDKIKTARKAKQMTQQDLANLAGISRVRLNQLESGNIFDVRFGTVAAILSALDLDFRVITANAGRPTFEELQAENEQARSNDAGPSF